MSERTYRQGARVLLAVVMLLGAPGAALACESSGIGLNKFDLALQYIGRASNGDGGPAHTQVTRAMARKAIGDAANLGVSYFRVSAGGYKPHDLDLWVKNPTQYWAALDSMMADLHQAGICIIPTLAWNPVQFPTMASESVTTMLTDPKSASWQLLERYVRDFIGHYGKGPDVLFYELTNELNNHADIDEVKVCARRKRAENCTAASNFSTDQMNEFMARFAALVRSLDSTHKISSGFTLPRPAAWHMRRHPQWLGRADWTPDSAEELEETLRDVHKSVDIISVHLYPPNSTRLGLASGEQYKIVAIVQAAASHIGKPLFIGEFGQNDIREANADSFFVHMTQEITRLKVAYSAAWIWEFYQVGLDAPYQSEPSYPSLEPGYTDVAIEAIRQANGTQRAAAAAARAAPAPAVVLTQPKECAAVNGGSELYAVASLGSRPVESVDFLIDGKSVGQVTRPPFTLSLPASGKSGLAEIEARACSAGKCSSYKTHVVMGADAAAGAQCQARAAS
jgi:hypothetical protein